MGINCAPSHDDRDLSSVGHRIANGDNVEKEYVQRGSVEDIELLTWQTLPELKCRDFQVRRENGGLSQQKSTSQVNSPLQNQFAPFCAPVTRRSTSASPIARSSLSICNVKLHTQHRQPSSTSTRRYASVPPLTHARPVSPSSCRTNVTSTTTPSIAALTTPSSFATPSPQSLASTKRRSRCAKERRNRAPALSPVDKRSFESIRKYLCCLIVCTLLLLPWWCHIISNFCDDNAVSASGEFLEYPPYRRYGSAACVRANNFTTPEAQRRLRASLLGFPRDDVVRTLLHSLAMMPHIQTGWWRREEVYRAVLSDSDSSARWYFTAKGTQPRRDGTIDSDATVCVAFGAVEVRAATEERYNDDGEKQLWTWMERTAWKIADASFKRARLKHPWILPSYLLPTSVQCWCEVLSLDLLPARLQQAIVYATTYALERLQTRIQLVSVAWAYTKSSIQAYASSLFTYNERWFSLWARAQENDNKNIIKTKRARKYCARKMTR